MINGDVCSVLYTNSPAMHSSLMRDFSPSMSSARLNAVIVRETHIDDAINHISKYPH